MPKSQYSKSNKGSERKESYSSPQGGAYKDRNLAAMAPEAAQEELKPTDAEPVRMQTRMAGCS